MGLVKRGRVYYFKKIIENEVFCVSTKCTDKTSAEEVARKLSKTLERKRAGLPTTDETDERTPAALIGEYRTELRRRGRCEQHVSMTGVRLTRMFAGLLRLSAMTAEATRSALVRLEKEHGLGTKSQNHHLRALRCFFNWLVREERWESNPAKRMTLAREMESELPWRALAGPECARLIAVAPPARAAVYRVAATTGLRRRELRALLWANIELSTGMLTLASRHSKNRRPVNIPLSRITVAALKALRGEAKPSDRVFSAIPNMKTFRRDLGKAKVCDNEDGRVVFHSLRGTFATSMARTGTSLVQAQKLMRHSTPALTANVYTKLESGDAREAVERLDALYTEVRPAMPTSMNAQRLTGTYGATDSREPKEAKRPTPEGVGLMVGPGLEPGTPGFSDSRGIAQDDSTEAFGDAPERGVHDSAHALPDPAQVARDLLALAETAPDPRPLIAAALALLGGWSGDRA